MPPEQRFSQVVKDHEDHIKFVLSIMEKTQFEDMAEKRFRRPNLRVSQLLFVVSDTNNLYQHGPHEVERAIQRLREQNVFVVFVIIDPTGAILKQKSVSFVGGKPITRSYMDRFTDKNYILLRDIQSLPEKLSDALRQWFEMIATASSNA